MGKLSDKVDVEKMDRAATILQEIVSLTQVYHELFTTLTKQEKHLAGGIVFRVRNVWNDFSLVGIMADRDIAREMLDTIVTFYQSPEQFKATGGNPKIVVGEGSTGDGLSN